MRSLFRLRSTPALRTRLSLGLLPALLLVGCSEPEQDDLHAKGGNSPDPTAVLEGSILYSGPRPACELRPDGTLRVRGNAILTMFDYDNPPPPEGTATTSLNLLVVSGEQLFMPSDCALDATLHVTRSARFIWPNIPLARAKPLQLQLRGFYDHDEDVTPFFSVTRLPTSGDVIGAALNDLSDPSQGFLRIGLPAIEAAPAGVHERGITIALGNQVRTERPVFRLDDHRKLAANTAFPLAFGAEALRTFRSLTCAGAADCGLTLKRFAPEEEAALKAFGVEVDLTTPKGRAIYATPVDFTTVLTGGQADVEVADGKADPHPFLGATLSVPWYAPMVIMQRFNPDPAQAEIERKSQLPAVLMLGTPLMVEGEGGALTPGKASYTGDIPISVPPVAALELKAGRNDCRLPYFAPGTPQPIMNERLAQCSELPAAYYSVNVLAGVAGGLAKTATNLTVNESTEELSGGIYSGQSWSIPNELGLPEQTGGADRAMVDQGLAGAFVVNDPTEAPSEGSESCTVGTLYGVCTNGYQFAENAQGIDTPKCLPVDCCEAIRHLYDPRVVACPKVGDALGNRVSTGPTAILGVTAEGVAIPNCVPFALPTLCRPAP